MLLLLLFLVTPWGADRTAHIKCRTLQTEITLRSGPAASSRAADSIACGQDVSITEEEKDHPGWVKIKTKSDQEGFVRITLLELSESKPAAPSDPAPMPRPPATPTP